MKFTDEDIQRVAKRLYEYQNGTGPKGDAWKNADFMTRRRYENLAFQALDSFTNN